MIRLVSTIKWHNAREESPKKDGKYLVLTNESMVIEYSYGTQPVTCLSVDYSVAVDKWNVMVLPDGTIDDPSTALDSVKWWAGIDDIEEVFIEEGKDE